jgi:hypothetical protein
MVVQIEFMVFWVAAPCSVVVGYQHFRGPSVSILRINLNCHTAWYNNPENMNLRAMRLVFLFHVPVLCTMSCFSEN